MKSLHPRKIKDQVVQIPGSKSISHRMLICAALGSETSRIENVLNSEDLQLTAAGLRAMGAEISHENPQATRVRVKGFNGAPTPWEEPIFLGNSGTSMRLLSGIAALGHAPYTLTGTPRMCERPMKEMVDALIPLGIQARAENGTPPVTITGGNRRGGATRLDCSQSSQFLSGLLMAGALLEEGVDIELTGPPVSAPYIDLTLDVMEKFGVEGRRISDTRYQVPGNQSYGGGDFQVEPDMSNAGYFWAAAAVSGTRMGVAHAGNNSLQGDFKQVYILEKMGCGLEVNSQGTFITGKPLHGIEVDMSDTPDAVPAIAVVAAFARGKTRMTHIAHLRAKECDRISVMAQGLRSMGIEVAEGDDFLEVTGGNPKGAMIHTFDDHRIAMAFAVAGLRVPGMEIENPDCVGKSFPTFWDVYDGLGEI
ncbi:MAG: 3-phosphoshikimate 1-carboxyvinyltransferase [Desulfobacterales bacterium]|nr:3-phosphoshikimate 1-carboxyvinyltransferase [Desulfobacterales bacterium]